MASICIWACNSYGLTSVTEEFCSLPAVTCSEIICPGIRHLNYIGKVELCTAAKLEGNRRVMLMVQGKQAMPQVLSAFSLQTVCLCWCSSSCHTTAYSYTLPLHCMYIVHCMYKLRMMEKCLCFPPNIILSKKLIRCPSTKKKPYRACLHQNKPEFGDHALAIPYFRKGR